MKIADFATPCRPALSGRRKIVRTLAKHTVRTAMALCLTSFTGIARGDSFSVLYAFSGQADGSIPYAGVAVDPAGALYGTTFAGGESGQGTVFKLTPQGSETVLYSFHGGADGSGPADGTLLLDSANNLYGTTYGGDTASDFGTVFKIAPNGTETTLYAFKGANDGAYPQGGLARDKKGTLYGTTSGGDTSSDVGTVFKVSPDGVQTVLYTFTDGAGGDSPLDTPLLDNSGNLYGTTYHGGNTGCPSGCGTVFKLAANGTYTVLHSFTGGNNDGAYPLAPLAQDAAGNLYGTTFYGGIKCRLGKVPGCGTVFKIAPDGSETVLYKFALQRGSNPWAGVTVDKAGNLYGATVYGGNGTNCDNAGCGVIFKLSPDGKETVLYSFNGTSDGADPSGNILIAHGDLYGTTNGYSGKYDYGSVFKLTK